MNKYVFQFLAGMLDELREDVHQVNVHDNIAKKDVLQRIKSLLNKEISIPCVGVIVNKSTTAQNFYGMIAFPKTVLSDQKGIEIKSYVVEFQMQILKELNGRQLAALLIHDLSHNVMTYTAVERLKAAIYHACKMTNMKVVDVMYNIDSKARDLALLDIANRTYKDPVVPGTEIYEADRVLVDMDIYNDYNAAVKKLSQIEEFDLSNPDNQDISDTYIASILVRIVIEKTRGMTREYDWHKQFVDRTYDTNVFKMYPSIDIEVKDEQFGERISQIENLRPYELAILQESTMNFIKQKQGTDESSLITESVFKQKRPNTIALQKEYDIITFKMQNMTSNYERLALLDRVYDNIYLMEKYLDQNPDDEGIKDFFKKFINLPMEMKELKPSKKRYDVFVEYPAGYDG